ncbi:MAG: hypothetical protein JOZ46_04260 [Candidatus Dormibacteraeota bacterium]|nr:hypothetical protein [Candidatus Dormibacteraeota bacterium]MBV9525013.1 hypothetical protein [Candidatus Dormibacteraeota bacterium]
MQTASAARRAWTLYEPIHAIVYFAPESLERYREIGLRGGWMGYFASRSAAMGAVGPEVVIATFHNFAPPMVRRALPDAWQFSTPERVLQARVDVVDSALRRLWGEDASGDDVAYAAGVLLDMAMGLHRDGRPLFAAHAALEVPSAPHIALWHACTLLREHRFDGHVAALTVHDVSGLEAHVVRVAAGDSVDAVTMRRFRGWTDEDWNAAADRLRDRGILDRNDGLTEKGHELLAGVEGVTDRLAAPPWDELDAAARGRILDVLLGLAQRLEAPGGLMYPNPVGVPRPG